MKYGFWVVFSLLSAACASTSPEPTRAHQIIYLTPIPSVAVSITATEEPLPFRDLSTATPLPTAIPPSPTLAPATLTPLPAAPTSPPIQLVVQPSAQPALIAQPSATAPNPPLVPTSTLVPTALVSSDTASAEQAVIDLSNSYRAQNGLPPLRRDESIMAIARSRSADMVARNFFDHTDPVTGAVLGKPLVLALGYGRTGENIYWSGAALGDFPAQAVKWFMNDAPHRANILASGYTAVGVGIVWNGLGWALTQNFAGP